MRSSSTTQFLVVLFFLLLGASAVGAAVAEERQGERGGRATTPSGSDAFYRQVGQFAVSVYCMAHGIRPVPKLERVVSASTQPAAGRGGGVDYDLVLRVAAPLGTRRAQVWGVPGEGSHDWKLKYFEPVKGA